MATVNRDLRLHGFTIMADRQIGTLSPYAYTVGMTLARRPELVVIGLSPTQGVDLLASLVERHREQEWGNTEEYVIPRRFRNDDPHEVYASFAAVEESGDYPLAVARRLYGERVRATQVIWPDKAGIRPPDPAFAGYAPQPLLPARADVSAWQARKNEQ
jgi:hypothetical protein